MRIILLSAVYVCSFFVAFSQQISPISPLPSKKQIQWQALEYYGFVHFNMNTFTNVEWGEGKESPSNFNPTALDCRQWARIAKAAGMKGLILTAKHHDGFALYPSKFTTHSVAKSPWKNGKGDVVKELAQACREYGLKLGIYLSPWDRFHPAYGTDDYNKIYAEMQKELLTQYGPIFEFWYDGANGEGPNGKKQVYDWPLFHSMVNKYQPNAVQFSDNGPDIRWVGNERGYNYETSWSPINRDEIYPGYPQFDRYKNGQENGSHWVAPEVDVSIRPGWYYHPKEDNKVKSPDSLMKIYVASVGRNANLLLNIPVDTRGLIHPNDSASMMGFAELRKKSLFNLLKPSSNKIQVSSTFNSTYTVKNLSDQDVSSAWAPQVNDSKPIVKINFTQSVLSNTLMLQEPIALGQRIKSFSVEIEAENGEKWLIKAKTIGNKRMLTFPERKVKHIRIILEEYRAQPLISNVALYRIISTRNESLYH
ncbi:alpha-L-fucosidase [Aquirufa aurantiipilula]|uniref:alpha-L-fucosidase n=1 Tax=Aquirufa aurantiipilula TaxID=2696561 RepID=A0ABT6BH73_9BACT|nr:alpha-L-fucosidase [Aquirufa aurantiipilula]MDF5689712.1 alpha-L-fucosidase [Aquirufa aurantiipilula]